jgi:hypothetical protein
MNRWRVLKLLWDYTPEGYNVALGRNFTAAESFFTNDDIGIGSYVLGQASGVCWVAGRLVTPDVVGGIGAASTKRPCLFNTKMPTLASEPATSIGMVFLDP